MSADNIFSKTWGCINSVDEIMSHSDQLFSKTDVLNKSLSKDVFSESFSKLKGIIPTTVKESESGYITTGFAGKGLDSSPREVGTL